MLQMFYSPGLKFTVYYIVQIKILTHGQFCIHFTLILLALFGSEIIKQCVVLSHLLQVNCFMISDYHSVIPRLDMLDSFLKL